MTEVISVRFKNKGKVYYFDPNGVKAERGDDLIVETAKGLEYAECAMENHEVDSALVIPPLRPVVRVATAEDAARAEQNRKKEAEAFEICREKIEKFKLDMKLVDVEYNFEGSKILFFFTSDGRVDFRELVKELASVFKTRVELRQIGVRDEARMLGGLGICGKPFCCAQFLDDFQPVSIKMAKTQGLSLNPTKISGTCGRLMCCLKYEQDAYEELVKNAPRVDAFIETEGGKGSVIDVNLLRRTARVRLEDQHDMSLKTISFDDLTVIGGKAARAEYLAEKAEQDAAKAAEAEKNPRPQRSYPKFKREQRPTGAENAASNKGDAGRPASGRDRRRPGMEQRPKSASEAVPNSGAGRPQQRPETTAEQHPGEQGDRPKKSNYRGRYRGKSRRPGGAPNAQGSKPEGGKPTTTPKSGE